MNVNLKYCVCVNEFENVFFKSTNPFLSQTTLRNLNILKMEIGCQKFIFKTQTQTFFTEVKNVVFKAKQKTEKEFEREK